VVPYDQSNTTNCRAYQLSYFFTYEETNKSANCSTNQKAYQGRWDLPPNYETDQQSIQGTYNSTSNQHTYEVADHAVSVTYGVTYCPIEVANSWPYHWSIVVVSYHVAYSRHILPY
jgi:hypothetical protein